MVNVFHTFSECNKSDREHKSSDLTKRACILLFIYKYIYCDVHMPEE
jgi:hypothetical protein